MTTQPCADLARFEASAAALSVAAAEGDRASFSRIEDSFPQRQPTSSERNEDGTFTLEACQLIVAREQGAASWGALSARLVCAAVPSVRHFVEAVFARDAERVERLLSCDGEQIVPYLDAPFFHFDAPAVVQSKHDRAVLSALIAAGADINARSAFWAGGFGVLDDVNEAQARWLIERGATVDLAVAAGQGWLDEVSTLLASDPSLVNRRFGDGKTALHWAKDVVTAGALLDAGADPNARDLDHGSSPAEHLIGSGSAVPRFLVEQGADCDVFLAAALGDIDLLDAALAQEPSSTRFRISRPPYTGVSDDWGGHIYQWTLGFDQSAHEVAFHRGQVDAYRHLMERSDERERFLAACLCDDQEALAAIDDPAAVVASLDLEDRKLLPIAAWHGRLPAVRHFLDAGFDPHLAGPEDSTPIDRAAFRGWAEVVELLLERDDDPPLERRNRFGGTPLSACLHGARLAAQHAGRDASDHVRTATALVDAGAHFEESWLPTGNELIDELLRARLPLS